MRRFLVWIGRRLCSMPRAVGLVLAIGWMAWIWTLSEHPGPAVPRTTWWAVVGNLLHAPLFGILALAFLIAAPRRREGPWAALERKHVAAILLAVLAYGVADEWHQSHTPGRDPSMLDVLTDFVGATCTVWIASYLRAERASEAGLWGRLAVGVLACVAAAVLSTAF